jgi:hypothetical protein
MSRKAINTQGAWLLEKLIFLSGMIVIQISGADGI